MRTDPSAKSPEDDVAKQQRIDRVTRIVALVLAFVSVFFFFIKLLFL